MIDKQKIAVIGLGYVGLPLALEFGKYFKTIGFDIKKSRISELISGKDSTREVDENQLKRAINVNFSNNLKDIRHCNIFIITVPTPIDKNNNPDLAPLISASKSISKFLKTKDIVIYESTVYPGATEEVCVPILENYSGLKFNQDFFCGYSPERINPGDKEHRITSIKKITSGSTPDVANKVDALYKKIISAGTHKAESIKVAEAAKVIENTQRDVNIALINELAMIFNKLDIDTEAVLKAAETKWNFLPFKPGLVGGHCIGVDPYYLTHKARDVGHEPEIILAGRRINDNIGSFIVSEISSIMYKKNISVSNSNILIMGLSFKEDCPDLRNSRVFDLISELKTLDCKVEVYDPIVNQSEAQIEYGIDIIKYPKNGKYDVIILAVSHKKFLELNSKKIRLFGKSNHVLYDVKYILKESEVDGRL